MLRSKGRGERESLCAELRGKGRGNGVYEISHRTLCKESKLRGEEQDNDMTRHGVGVGNGHDNDMTMTGHGVDM